MTRTLADWLAYQEHVNVHSIELGLDRVREVWQRMGAPSVAGRVITVGGTNGKGSTVALLEAMGLAAGLAVGSFTSPHLLRYNERVRIGGVDVDDASLVASFERIEAARTSGEAPSIPLTYFEFGTLAALDLFSRASLDLAMLEVGLGGRLDAVNIIDADAVIITTVDLDHMDWLGNDRDTIGREKAGIARTGRPAIVGETEPPAGLLDALTAAGSTLQRAGQEFFTQRQPEAGWRWQHRDGTVLVLPDPWLAAPVQYANAAAAIAALHALWPIGATTDAGVAMDSRAIAQGLRAASPAARLQLFDGHPPVLVDVGHNPQAARALAAWLDAQPPARVHAVYGALADKDVGGVIDALGARIDRWHLGGLEQASPRGLSINALSQVLQQTQPGAQFDEYADVLAALDGARQAAQPDDRILAFGSFFVASAVVARMASERAPSSGAHDGTLGLVP